MRRLSLPLVALLASSCGAIDASSGTPVPPSSEGSSSAWLSPSGEPSSSKELSSSGELSPSGEPSSARSSEPSLPTGSASQSDATVEYEEDGRWEAVFAQEEQPDGAQCKDGDLWVNEGDLSVLRRRSGAWEVVYDGHLGASFLDHVSVLTRDDEVGKLSRALVRTLFAPSLTAYATGGYFNVPEDPSSMADIEPIVFERKGTYVDGRVSVVGYRSNTRGPAEAFEEYYWRGEDGLAYQWPGSFSDAEERAAFAKNGFVPAYALRREISLPMIFGFIEKGLSCSYSSGNHSYGWDTAGDAGENRRVGVTISTFLGEPYINTLNMVEAFYDQAGKVAYTNAVGYTLVHAGTTAPFEIPDYARVAESA